MTRVTSCADSESVVYGAVYVMRLDNTITIRHDIV